MLRRQLPVYSPISLASLLSGWKSLIAGSSDRATAAIRSAISDKFAADEILLTDSGTTALRLAIRGTCEARGKRLVALPAYGCYDLATAADGAGAEVVLYDVNPQTLGPNFESLTSALERDPAALVVAHLYGVPLDMDAVTQVAERRDVPVIEDAAQGHGATLEGRHLGSFGPHAVLSFGRGKGITGGGGGGLIATTQSSAAIVRNLAATLAPAPWGLRQLVVTSAQWALARPSLYQIPASIPLLSLGKTIYRRPTPPKVMSRTACSLLATNWDASETEAASRRATGKRLAKIIDECKYVDRIEVPFGSQPGYLRFPVLVSVRVINDFASAYARRLGIMSAYPKSLADLPGFGDRRVNRTDPLPGARFLADRLFTLPSHGKLTAADVRRLESWLRRIGNSA